MEPKATPPTQEPKHPKVWKGKVYGTWSHNPESLGSRPRCLHLFSGPARKGDLAEFLSSMGWAVCSVDTEQIHATDLRDDRVTSAIMRDIKDDVFDFVFLGTPCNTYCALREIPPGPRPLRSATELTGLKKGLNQSELKELKEGNHFTRLSAKVMAVCLKLNVGFMMENPEPSNAVTIFYMEEITAVTRVRGVEQVNFDQCRFGADATKPTRIIGFKVNFKSLQSLRCDHPICEWVDRSGKTYKASHERVAGRFRVKEDGTKEFASKALAHYKPALCKVLAEIIVKVDRERAKTAASLAAEHIP